MTTETTQSSGATAKPIAETYETLHARLQQEANPPETAPKPEEVTQHDGNQEGESDTSADSADKELSAVEKAKQGTPKGVQKRLDQLTRDIHERDRLIEQQSKLLERLADKGEEFEPVNIPEGSEPVREHYKSDGDYFKAMVAHTTKQELARIEADRKQAESKSRLDIAEEAARSKYEDYDDALALFQRSGLSRNTQVLEVIQESDIGPELMRHMMVTDGLEAELSKLPAYRVAAKLAALEDSLKEPPKQAAKPANDLPPPPGKIAGPSPSIDDFSQFQVADASPDLVQRRIDAARRKAASAGRQAPY